MHTSNLVLIFLCGVFFPYSQSNSSMDNYISDERTTRTPSMPSRACAAPRESDRCCCASAPVFDKFIYSRTVNRDSVFGKVFLYPWNQNERYGDWYHNKGYCQRYDAEMVSIEDQNESEMFSGFMRNLGMTRPGVWLGAQSFNDTSSIYWTGDQSGKKASYTNFRSGVLTKSGLSCLHMGLQLDDELENPWGTDHCNDKSYFIACQKIVKV